MYRGEVRGKGDDTQVGKVQGKHPASALRSAQGTRGPYGEKGMAPRWVRCKANTLPAALQRQLLTRARFTRHSSRHFCTCSAVPALKTYMMGGGGGGSGKILGEPHGTAGKPWLSTFGSALSPGAERAPPSRTPLQRSRLA